MSPFKARRKGRVYAELPPYAAGLVVSLARQLVELLSEGEPTAASEVDPLEDLLTMDGPREAPEDPALRRLLPDGHSDDAEASAEFRRFTERGLRQSKVTDARVVIDSVGDVGEDEESDIEFELDHDQAMAWMRCLNDLRLTLAARLDVKTGDEEFWESLPEDDERRPVYEIYGWLGYVLESLIDAVHH